MLVTMGKGKHVSEMPEALQGKISTERQLHSSRMIACFTRNELSGFQLDLLYCNDLAEAENIVASPSIVDSLSGFHIEMVALGSEHSVAITGCTLLLHSKIYLLILVENGDMLSWGAGGSGQLGHGHHPSILSFLRSSREYTPRLVRTLEGVKVRKIAAGLLHSACIDENGSVFLFGQRTTDKLGFAEANIVLSPSAIKLPSSQQVSCGAYHTCVVTSRS
ncbi:hypothetical protein EJ110_NYTH49229 [Nymphaea thermarum]|nr:hypothetical protein EJ110_NYTH49229 [Nymphaea thermarum]